LLQKELELTMTLAGTTCIEEIDESYVYQPASRWVRYAPRGKSAAGADQKLRLVAKL
ncbi:hypothetical protein GGF37_005797, partial [Kickxella alabastrina]